MPEGNGALDTVASSLLQVRKAMETDDDRVTRPRDARAKAGAGGGGLGVRWPPQHVRGACERRPSCGARQRRARRRAPRALGRRRRRWWRCGRRRHSGRLVGPTRRVLAATTAPRLGVAAAPRRAWRSGDAVGVLATPADACVATLVWACVDGFGAVGGVAARRRATARHAGGVRVGSPASRVLFQRTYRIARSPHGTAGGKAAPPAALSMNGVQNR